MYVRLEDGGVTWLIRYDALNGYDVTGRMYRRGNPETGIWIPGAIPQRQTKPVAAR